MTKPKGQSTLTCENALTGLQFTLNQSPGQRQSAFQPTVQLPFQKALTKYFLPRRAQRAMM